jgi:hypothetical protein
VIATSRDQQGRCFSSFCLQRNYDASNDDDTLVEMLLPIFGTNCVQFMALTDARFSEEAFERFVGHLVATPALHTVPIVVKMVRRSYYGWRLNLPVGQKVLDLLAAIPGSRQSIVEVLSPEEECDDAMRNILRSFATQSLQ